MPPDVTTSPWPCTTAKLPGNDDRSYLNRNAENPAGCRLLRIVAARKNCVPVRHRDLQIGTEPVRRIIVHREPARRIQQVRCFGMNRRELDAEHRRLLIAGQLAVVDKRQRRDLALLERLWQCQPDAHVLRHSRRRNLPAVFIDHARDVQRVVQLERDRRRIFQRNKASPEQSPSASARADPPARRSGSSGRRFSAASRPAPGLRTIRRSNN